MRNSNLNFLGTIDSFLINEIIRPFLPKLWDIEIDDIEIINILSEEESIPFVQEYITREIYLSDITDVVIDYRGKTPKKLGGEWIEKGYKALSAKNIKTGKIVHKILIGADGDLGQADTYAYKIDATTPVVLYLNNPSSYTEYS